MEKTITIEEVTIKYLFIYDGISMYWSELQELWIKEINSRDHSNNINLTELNS